MTFDRERNLSDNDMYRGAKVRYLVEAERRNVIGEIAMKIAAMQKRGYTSAYILCHLFEDM